VTIIVLGSGLYLWAVRARVPTKVRLARLEEAHAAVRRAS
jgi:hypothetical protein